MDNKLLKRSEVDNKYKWDLSPIYSSVEEFNKDLKKLSSMIENFKKYQKDMMSNGTTLYET